MGFVMAALLRSLAVVFSVPGIAVSVSVSVSVSFPTPPLAPLPPLIPPDPLIHSHPHLHLLSPLFARKLPFHPTRLCIPNYFQRIRPRELRALARNPRRNGKPQRRAQCILFRLFYACDLFGAGAGGVLSGFGVVAFGVPGEIFVFLPAADG